MEHETCHPTGGNKADEPINFYDHLTHWVKLNPIFSEAESFGCKNQVDVLKMK